MKDKRTYAQRADYIKKAVAKRRKTLRDKAISQKGGKCLICGYAKFHGALEFHHIDPLKKDFSLSADGSTRAWARIEKEIQKCVLVCANCHREIHAGITQLSAERRIEK
jgi:predicted HNH restriction endonuclease